MVNFDWIHVHEHPFEVGENSISRHDEHLKIEFQIGNENTSHNDDVFLVLHLQRTIISNEKFLVRAVNINVNQEIAT